MVLIRPPRGQLSPSSAPSEGQVVGVRAEVYPVSLCCLHRTYHTSGHPENTPKAPVIPRGESGGTLAVWCESGPVFR